MKLSRILITAAALTALTSLSTLSAQENKAPRGRMSPEQQLERYDQQLTLTAEQKTKIKDILTKAQEKIQALPQEERREKGRQISQETNKEIRALLTAEQQTKFDEMNARRPRGEGKKKSE